MYWELLGTCWGRSVRERIVAATGAQVSPSSRPRARTTAHLSRAIFIGDTDPDAPAAFEASCSSMRRDLSINITSEWLATYSPQGGSTTQRAKDALAWVPGVDGTATINECNTRAWGNALAIRYKTMDIVVAHVGDSGNSGNRESIYAILFALDSTCAGGAAFIELKAMSVSLASMMYIFARQFTSVNMIHSTICDSIFICGLGYMPMTARARATLRAQAGAAPDCTFIETPADDFDAFLRHLAALYERMHVWRNMLRGHIATLARVVASDMSHDNIERTIAATFADETAAWIAANDYRE